MRCLIPRSSRSHSRRGDDARDDVEREDALGAAPSSPFSVKVMPMLSRARSAAACRAASTPRLEPVDAGDERLEARPRVAELGEHLVVKRAVLGVVAVEVHGSRAARSWMERNLEPNLQLQLSELFPECVVLRKTPL